jgi:ribonuclease HI
VISRCEKEEVELFSIIARLLWHCRNVVVHGGEFMPPNQVVKEVVTSLEDFQRVNQMGEAQVGASKNRDEKKWKPPLENMLKINWDIAMDTKTGVISVGIIVRDWRGSFIAAESKHLLLCAEPVVAETLAALQALMFCTEQGFQNVLLEGDALQVVNMINSDKPCDRGYGHLVEDIREVSRSLGETRVQHVRRSANKVAHELALLARTHVTNTRWYSTPPCISGIVMAEGILSTS